MKRFNINAYAAAVGMFLVVSCLFPLVANATVIHLGPAIITVDVESDFNDWQWNFKLQWNGGSNSQDITSFHISGLEGDVTDSWEYEDFQASDGWTNPPSLTKGLGAIDWSVGTGVPLGPTNLVVNLSFDSDYAFDPQRIYKIAVDDKAGRWHTGYIHVPEPSTIFMMFGTVPMLLLCSARNRSRLIGLSKFKRASV